MRLLALLGSLATTVCWAQKVVVLELAGDEGGKLHAQVEAAARAAGVAELVPTRTFNDAVTQEKLDATSATAQLEVQHVGKALGLDAAVVGEFKGGRYEVVILDRAGQELWSRRGEQALPLERGLLAEGDAQKLAHAIAAAAFGSPIAAAGAPCAGAPLPAFATTPTEPRVGRDDLEGKRERAPAAVVLYGRLVSGQLRLLPMVCVLEGVLRGGKACGLAMPASARVRLTRSAGTALPGVLSVFRGKPALAPACCTYAACEADTVSYSARGLPKQDLEVLAVWPETADVGLVPEPSALKPEGPAALAPRATRPDQCLHLGSRWVAAAWSGPARGLQLNEGQGWKAVLPRRSLGYANRVEVLATTDVDGDGEREALVHAGWANDYGFYVFGRDWSAPLYSFNCGNI